MTVHASEHLGRLLDAMPEGAFINTDDCIARCNPALLNLLGLSSPDELLGKSPLTIFHPRHHDVIRERIHALRTHPGAAPVIEEELVHLDHGTIPVEVVATSFDHEGQPCILVILRDLRPRKDLETRFRLLVDAVTDHAVYTLDAAGRIASWNDGAMRLHGYTPAEALGQAHSILFTAERVAAGAPEQALAAALAEESLPSAWYSRKGGSRFWAKMVVTAQRDRDGQPQGYVVIVRDLTEHQKREAALTTSEGRYRDLFDCVTDPLFVYDRDTLEYIEVNDAAVAHYGYSRDEFLRMTIRDIRPVEDVPQLLDMLSHSGTERESRGIWRHQKRDGTIIHVEVSARGLRIGDRPACLVHARDVSARVKAERDAAEMLTALQQSQSLARIASAAARLGGWVAHLSDHTLTWSDEVCSLHDVPPGYQPTADEALAFYAPEHREAIGRAMTACAQHGTPFDLELAIVSAKQRRLWVRAIGEAVRNAAGRVVRVQGAFQDISAARASMDATRLSEERFRLLSRAATDVVWDWDMVSGAHWWNEGVQLLFGYRSSEVEQTIRFRLDRVHPDDLEALSAVIKNAIDSGAESWSAEYRFRHREGGYLYVLDRGHVLRDASGAAVRMVGGMTDLSARRRDQERIAEQAALLEEARDAIVVRDLSLRLTYCNRSAARLYGFDSVEGAKRSSREHPYLDSAKVEAARHATLEHGGWSGELEVHGSGGRTLLVASHWSLVRDRDGQPRAFLMISTDITATKSLEMQVIRAQRLESIGTLAAGIAHDLNNILAPILASIDFLRDGVSDDPDMLDTLDTLDICTRRGADLVKQVLHFARGLDGQRVPVNLVQLAADLLKVLEDTLPRSIALRFHPSPGLWSVTGDATQLHQVLLNLCVNARDAMPEGGRLEVTMENVVLDETYASMNIDALPGPYVVVKVTDTGNGIPPEVRERIFDPFFTTKEVGKGTGLGLSTTLSIVKSHGGFINVYSEPGKGTRFRVYIPADASSTASHEVSVKRTRLPRGEGETVLVVDDEAAIRSVVRNTLERFGYSVLLASHGAEAVALYAQHQAQIALVLTDMAMPVMDGPATIIAMKMMNPAVTIVASSGLVSNGDLARAVGAGCEFFVSKPYTAEALLSTLAKALGKTSEA